MKKIHNIKDLYKMLIIYFISTVIYCVYVELTIEYNHGGNPDFIYALIVFTLTFLFLIRLFKVQFKSIQIFLGIVMFLLIFRLLNLDAFAPGTPSPLKFPVMFLISIYTTIPFQSIFFTIEGYFYTDPPYYIVPIYMIILTFLSYIVLKFKNKII